MATRLRPPLAQCRAGEPSSPRRSHRARMRRHAGAAGASPARKDGDDSAPARTLTRVSAATSSSFFLFFLVGLVVWLELLLSLFSQQTQLESKKGKENKGWTDSKKKTLPTLCRFFCFLFSHLDRCRDDGSRVDVGRVGGKAARELCCCLRATSSAESAAALLLFLFLFPDFPGAPRALLHHAPDARLVEVD